MMYNEDNAYKTLLLNRQYVKKCTREISTEAKQQFFFILNCEWFHKKCWEGGNDREEICIFIFRPYRIQSRMSM